MKKREYMQPSLKMAMINSCVILCGSTLDKGKFGDVDTPTPGSDGSISAESKRGGLSDDEWDD